MTNTFTKIVSFNPSGSLSSFTLNNIPQNFTDLKLVITARASIGAVSDLIWIYPNGSSSNADSRFFQADSSTQTAGSSNYIFIRNSGSTATANIYSNCEVYINNYSSTTTYKQFVIQSTSENQAQASYYQMQAALWSNTLPITSITFSQNSSTNFYSNSTFTLYGI